MTDPTPFNDLGREIIAALPHFTGSDTFTRHPLRHRMLITEGVVYVANKAGAHWLTDIVASYQHTPRAKAQPFQVWHLLLVREPEKTSSKARPTVRYGDKDLLLPRKYDAVIYMTDGNSGTPIIAQRIPYTDFPLSHITLWLENDVLMLPSER